MVSRPGSISAAVMKVKSSGEEITLVSMYAHWMNPIRQTRSRWMFADASVHRLISDLCDLIGRQKGHKIITAGDLNILHDYGENGSLYWKSRYDSVFDRMKTLGLYFVGPQSLKNYEIQMGDLLEDGTKIYKYWQNKGLADILSNYVKNNRVAVIWSLLPNSMPNFQYHQVFNSFWKESKTSGIDCFHVNVPGARISSGYQRAKWLKTVCECDPDLLLHGTKMPKMFSNIPRQVFSYKHC